MLNKNHLTEQQHRVFKETPYDTKIQIFEKLCAGCDYAYLKVTEVLNRATGEMAVENTFHSFEDFINFIHEFSFKKNLVVERGCLFGVEQIAGLQNREPYWTVAEIVSNTCEFWRYEDEETQDSLDDEFFNWYHSGAKVVSKALGAVLSGEIIDDEYLEQLPPAFIPEY